MKKPGSEPAPPSSADPPSWAAEKSFDAEKKAFFAQIQTEVVSKLGLLGSFEMGLFILPVHIDQQSGSVGM